MSVGCLYYQPHMKCFNCLPPRLLHALGGICIKIMTDWTFCQVKYEVCLTWTFFCLKLVLHDPIYRLFCSWHFVQWNLDFFWHFCVFIWHDWMLCTNGIACIWATSLEARARGQVSFKLILNDQHMFWSHHGLLIFFPCICNLGFPGIFIEDYCHFQYAKRQIILGLTSVSKIPDCRPLREIQVAKKSLISSTGCSWQV